MAKVDKCRQLSIEQENAIDLLLQGKSDREVAEAVGVSRQTVTEWRNGNALFAAELNRRRREVWGGQTERLRQLIAQAGERFGRGHATNPGPQAAPSRGGTHPAGSGAVRDQPGTFGRDDPRGGPGGLGARGHG